MAHITPGNKGRHAPSAALELAKHFQAANTVQAVLGFRLRV